MRPPAYRTPCLQLRWALAADARSQLPACGCTAVKLIFKFRADHV